MKYLNLHCINSLLFFFLLLIIFYDVEACDTFQMDSSTVKDDSVFVMTKSPTSAMIQSAIIPGLGQFYNESYWKIPVIWGFIGYYLSVWISQNDKYNFYKSEYSKSISTLNPDGDLRLKSYRNFYHNQRDEFTIYLFITYFLNIVDAYVDAHLFDFTAEPIQGKLNLSIRIKL